MIPGERVCIGKSKALKGTVVSVQNSLAQVIVDGHKKPSTFLASSLSPAPREKPKRVARKSEVQPSLGLTRSDQLRDQFIAQYNAAPDCDPLDLIGRRYTDPKGKTLRPDCGPFDYERFTAFGHFLTWLESQPRSSHALCHAAALHT